MGAGDRFMQEKFSVPMSGKGKWPFDNEKPEEIISHEVCGECGARVPVTGAGATIHMDLRDEGRPSRRVCFGKVVTR